MTLSDWVLVAIFGAELIIIGYLIDLKRGATMEKRTRVEFIESYWKDGNTDYIWNDNHGELIRCKDCKHLNKEEMRCFNTEGIGYRNVTNNDYCSRGERRDEVEECQQETK